jgi:hypothetical protein
LILLAGLLWAAACGDDEAETGSTNATNPDEVEAGDYVGTCYNDPDSDGLAENDFSQPSTEPCSSDSWHVFALEQVTDDGSWPRSAEDQLTEDDVVGFVPKLADGCRATFEQRMEDLDVVVTAMVPDDRELWDRLGGSALCMYRERASILSSASP